MAEKMKLRVDLQCPCFYEKVKKILCKFPQIRDQVYDEKNNIVKIIVIGCNPEKIRDKLCCKGEKVIKSIEIVEPPPAPEPIVPVRSPPPSPLGSTKKSNSPTPIHVQVFPIGACCPQCYGGHPCCQWYGYFRPVSPPPCYYNYGYPYGYIHSYNRGFYVSRCDQCFSDENPSACSIM